MSHVLHNCTEGILGEEGRGEKIVKGSQLENEIWDFFVFFCNRVIRKIRTNFATIDIRASTIDKISKLIPPMFVKKIQNIFLY